jgi:hypothetical protein
MWSLVGRIQVIGEETSEMDDGLFLQNWIVIEKLIWCKARLSLLLLF